MSVPKALFEKFERRAKTFGTFPLNKKEKLP